MQLAVKVICTFASRPSKNSLVPRPPLFFFVVVVLQFAFSIIHKTGAVVKDREGLGTPLM